MRKALVTYATKSGSVSGIAERIAETLASAGVHVDVKPVGGAPDPSAYDSVVVGSGVRMGSWHQPAKDWVKAHAEVLKGKPVAFFTVGLIIVDASKTPEVHAFTDQLIAESGVSPLDVGLFAGWGIRKRFGFLERTIMNAMKAPDDDRRDMDAVAAWTSAIVPKLAVEG